MPLIYIGDANRNTYRTAEQVFIMPSSQTSSSFFQDTGLSKSYGKLSPANGTTLSSLDEDNVPNDCFLWNQTLQAVPNFSHAETYPVLHKGQEHYTGAASNPLESSAATITWDMTAVVDDTNPQSPTATVSYNHTCFPAHEIKVNGMVVYQYHPPFSDPSYLFNCLFLHINPVVGQTQPTTVPTH